MTRILVIKHGALGDIVQATGPFAAIRQHHADAEITLLTTKPFADLLAAAPWFDQVAIDHRAPWWRLGQQLALVQLLNRGFTRVYDLQTSHRSSGYLRLIWPRPEWSGIARGCSHPDPDPNRDRVHTIDRQRGQLAGAGIVSVPAPSLDWIASTGIAAPDRFALLVPGGSAHRPAKRWPHFCDLARTLVAAEIVPLVIGTAADQAAVDPILAAVPQAISLVGRTRFADIVTLARRAAVAVGNDTGPMHLAAVAGAPSLVVFSAASEPALCRPVGVRVEVIQVPDLVALAPQTVAESAFRMLAA
jgi:ADP-heptose:LPS heptosyltransferase